MKPIATSFRKFRDGLPSTSAPPGEKAENKVWTYVSLLFTALAVAIWVFTRLNAFGMPLAGPHAPDGIITFELAGSANHAGKILEQWRTTELSPVEREPFDASLDAAANLTGIDAATASIKWDFAFIPAYVLVLVAACGLLAELFKGRAAPPPGDDSRRVLPDRVLSIGQRIAPWMMGAALCAGVLDVIENFMLLHLLQLEPGAEIAAWRPGVARIAAAVKFLLIGLVMGYIVAASFLLFLKNGGWIIRRAVLLRVPILIVIAVEALALLGAFGPSTLRNAMITSGFLAPALIVFQLILILKLAEFIAQFVWKTARIRFRTPDNPGLPVILDVESGKASVSYAILARFYLFLLPLIAVVIYWFDGSKWVAGLGAFMGAVAAGLFFELMQHLARKSSTMPQWRLTVGKGLTRFLGPGFGYEVDGENNNPAARAGALRDEHVQLTLTFFSLALVYFAAFSLLDPRGSFVDRIPPLAYVLGLLMFLLSVLSGAAFILDRYRVPVLIGITAWTSFVYGTHRVDHLFHLYRDGARETADPVESLRARLHPSGDAEKQSEEKVVTVICADGGGIQAAAWTCRVLQGLCEGDFLAGAETEGDLDEKKEELGKNFARSLGLIASTSGGSVGAYHFLESFEPESPIPPAGRLGRVFEASHQSSLEEALWGMVFPDLFSTMAPSLVSDFKDRGWAIERAWLKHTAASRKPDGKFTRADLVPTRWSNWIARTESGRLPAVIFNSTFVETGNQLLISTVKLTPRNAAGSQLAILNTLETFYQPGFGKKNGAGEDLVVSPVDLDAVTAARMSATFPVITPSARAVFSKKDRAEHGYAPSWHVADGGFYDNSGIVPAVAWIRQIMNHNVKAQKQAKAAGAGGDESKGGPRLRSVPIKKIIVIRIVPFPKVPYRPPFDSLDPPGGRGQSPAAMALWPVQTLASVRTSSQTARGMLELQLLEDRHDELIDVVELRMPLSIDKSPPLSWQLSEQNVENLNDSWERLVEDSLDEPRAPLAQIRTALD